MPLAEPRQDVRAQIAALLNCEHPKDAVFLVPDNARDIPALPPAIHRHDRNEGILLTVDPAKLAAFRQSADDRTMAAILGYPQDKEAAVAACGGDPYAARAVQARSNDGFVVTETFVSPDMVEATCGALSGHGEIVVLSAISAIGRRLSLRRSEANG